MGSPYKLAWDSKSPSNCRQPTFSFTCSQCAPDQILAPGPNSHSVFLLFVFSLILFLLFFLPELSFHSSHSLPSPPSHKLSSNVSGSMKLPDFPRSGQWPLQCVPPPTLPPQHQPQGTGLHAQLSISFTTWNIQLLISKAYSPLSTDF